MAVGSDWSYAVAMSTDREYQRQLVAAIDAEMGVRRWSRRHLSELAGITSQTMDRIFLLRRDLNVQQLDSIAHALGVSPEYLVGKAKEWRDHPSSDDIIDATKELSQRQKDALKREVASTRLPRDSPANDVVQSPNASGGEAV
jgi:transcriptional regulator with XRE-family HTH domain